MSKKTIINSRTSGKYKKETIDGREHLVTIMMPIRGDITMNGIYYPDKQVADSFMQLNMLPAPNGHPKVNGVDVSAYHPVANNKHNIGGYLRNPRKKGKRVFVDFLLDVEVANKSDEGKELIKRIESGERVGVSTGLGIERATNQTGIDDFGEKYDKIGEGYHFDHVAILLDEEAAGKHAGTELVLNESGEKISVYFAEWQVNDLSVEDLTDQIGSLIRRQYSEQEDVYTWVSDIYPDSKSVIYSVSSPKQSKKMYKRSYKVDQNDTVTIDDDIVEVVVDYKDKNSPTPATPNPEINPEESEMDKAKLVLSLIGNSNNSYTVADNDKLMAMSESELLAIIAKPVDLDQAKAIVTNSGMSLDEYQEYQANKAQFAEYLARKEEAVKGKIETIVKNSKYTAEMLNGKSEQELDVIADMIKPDGVAIQAPKAAPVDLQTNSNQVTVDYSV